MNPRRVRRRSFENRTRIPRRPSVFAENLLLLLLYELAAAFPPPVNGSQQTTFFGFHAVFYVVLRKGYPVSSTNPYILWSLVLRNDLFIRHRLGDNGLLQKAVEQQPA
jgi:hypothetical protein